MVDVQPPESLRLPRSATKGVTAIKYLAHAGKGRNHRCDDCLELFAEFYAGDRQGKPPPLARNASWKRVQTGQERILCGEHKQLRVELETTR